MDHRDVSEIYPKLQGTEAMQQFFADTGAVRISYSKDMVFADITRTKPLTDKQVSALKSILPRHDSVVVDFYDNFTSESPTKSFEYDMPLVSDISKMLDDIQRTKGGDTTVENDTSDVGLQFDSDSESVASSFSIRTWDKSEYVQDKESRKSHCSAIGVGKEKAMKYIDDVNGIAKYIADNADRLDYDASPFSVMFKTNSEYGGSIDASTLCAKRLLMTGTIDQIQKAFPDSYLTAEDTVLIRKMMKDKNLQVACGICYVEASRKDIGKYVNNFLTEYKNKHKDTSFTMVDFNTVDGLENVRGKYPEAYNEFMTFMNKLNQQKPKIFEKRTEYRNEILGAFKNFRTIMKKECERRNKVPVVLRF